MTTLKELLQVTNIKGYPEDEQIDIIGNLFDASFDESSLDGIQHAFNLVSQVNQDKLSEKNYTVLQYDLSNGWSYIRKIKFRNTELDWKFQIDELTNEVFYLRKAIVSPGFKQIELERQCQIYTNLGNSFSHIGRFVEAQEYWNKALDILPTFAMALGNRGNGLYHYGVELFDEIHKTYLIIFSFHDIKKALKYKYQLHEDAYDWFKGKYDFLFETLRKYKTRLPNLNRYDLGKNGKLVEYRKWCLGNKLYINPLNDLGAFTNASHDVLSLPTLMISAKRPPVFINLYNQIKQEYSTARYCYYISMSGGELHISDVDVPLVNTFEQVQYSYYVEQLKMAYRISYSVLDKIAFLLNDYLKIGLEPERVKFSSLWYSDMKKKVLRPFFAQSTNWALRGLYWLSRDLYDRTSDYDQVLEPEAKEIATIRNYIEHKGLKVKEANLSLPFFYDRKLDISYTITREELELKTMKLLKLTRAAIMYVSLAISYEESQKDYSKLKVIPIANSNIPDKDRV